MTEILAGIVQSVKSVTGLATAVEAFEALTHVVRLFL